MQLFLVQHGVAKPKDEDPERPLTDDGRRDVEAVLLVLMRYGAIAASRVMHSGKRRAQETAEIIAQKLDAEVEETDGLAPDDDPAVWAGRLATSDRDLVLVGHLPHLERLGSLLLTGDSHRGPVRFANAGVVCLVHEDGRWAVRWALTPDLVRE